MRPGFSPPGRFTSGAGLRLVAGLLWGVTGVVGVVVPVCWFFLLRGVFGVGIVTCQVLQTLALRWFVFLVFSGVAGWFSCFPKVDDHGPQAGTANGGDMVKRGI